MANKLLTIHIIAFFCCLVGLSDQLQADEKKVDYLKDIKPLLELKCYACHGVLKQEAELRLETKSLMVNGGDSGPALVPGKADESLLLERILAEEDERMPPHGEGEALNKKEIKLVRNWITQGAIAPKESTPKPPSEHWAYQVPKRAKIPKVKNKEWSTNPIDAFLAAKHESQKLLPVPLAEKRILLRRVYLDLTGLPPTKEEFDLFTNDNSSNAYENVVDKLLNSPQHGERWARHWMDIWRYSDWYGLGKQLRYSQKHIWRWRDWILESLNEDKGYDRMIMQMLAADEISPTDKNALRATGYLARQYFIFNRTTWLDNTVEHTAKSILGITMNCTKCHDHKYDPVTQEEYYRFRAIFEPYQVRLDAIPGETNFDKDGLPRIFDAHPETPTYLHVRGNEKDPDKSIKITPGVPKILGKKTLIITPVSLPSTAHNPALQPFVLKDQLKAAQKNIQTLKTAEQKAKNIYLSVKKEKETSTKLTKSVSKLGQLFLKDDFKLPNPKVWETGLGDWVYSEGNLQQLKTGSERAFLQSQIHHPKNFQARMKFVIKGGKKWRSVGLAFDMHQDKEKLVYISAVSPGSKLQYSYKKDGRIAYPTSGNVSNKIELNKTYDLKITVKDSLVNVTLNNKLLLARKMETKRNPGYLQLTAFDAQVDFISIEIHELPKDVELFTKASSGTKKESVEQAKANWEISKKTLAAAILYPAVLETALTADLAKSKKDSPTNLTELIQNAVQAGKKHKIALAEIAVAKTNKDLLLTNKKSKSKHEKNFKSAKNKLAKLQKTLNEKSDQYTPLRGSQKAMEGPDEKPESRYKQYPSTSTGRRTAFAKWITSNQNPLTARVAVNHIWLRHFGQPLVESVTDFGLRAKEPVQQDLLDWLATELMENNWSMKHIHRLMVTSRLYQLSSSSINADEKTKSIDPKNQYYWRRKPLRMESQVIRDSILQLAGVLDLTMGGPTFNPNRDSTLMRRSIYFAHSRDQRSQFLTMFDDADILQCYRRENSIIPQQALALCNSKLSIAMSRKITKVILKENRTMTDKQFIQATFELLLATSPSPKELAACENALKQYQKAISGLKKKPTDKNLITLRARENIVHALLNHNDFITIR